MRLWFATIAVLHLVWGILLLGWAEAAGGTGLAALPFERDLLAAFLIGTSLLAFWALTVPPSVWTFTALIPQQLLLIASATGAGNAVLAGHYGDGVVRHWSFILGDQLPLIALAASHALAVVVHHVFGNGGSSP